MGPVGAARRRRLAGHAGSPVAANMLWTERASHGVCHCEEHISFQLLWLSSRRSCNYC